ncbi:MAG TPA: GxxExxY protein [Gemmataceae bacterium]|nr:GxxExxY protein [Gemmataceae bacterium]
MLKHRELTEQIIKAYYKVYNTLGYGFLEKVYQNAMVIELRKRGLDVVPQASIQVFYEGEVVGEYFADVLVNGLVILEFKAYTALIRDHGTQLINYLKASRLDVGLLFNFGPKPEFQRRVYDHSTGADEIEDL